ncbi:Pleckstrin homology domain-containing protein [Dichomitus squalens]|uniref:Pleckstrin homology domain-containing protein n=1 Tax=Dichomitus squalens TaxID=114155 RepID=A0A4Q9MRM2_9APHY|nr:Pleckstrin homology domain-containing protein [Dichomitus squalens]
MKVGDGDGGKSNKLAALTGMGDPNGPNLFPGRDTPSSMRSYQRAMAATAQKPFDPTEDDPVEHKATAAHDQSHYVVAPSIHVQSEFPTITRSSEPSQPLTCLVVVELPGKRQNTHVPGSVMPVSDAFTPQQKNPALYRDGSNHSVHSGNHPGDYAMSPQIQSQHIPADQQSQSGRSHRMSPSASRDPLVTSPLEREIIQQDEDSPFSSITEDLRNRIIDWKGHPLSGLGPLQMYDLLSVRRDALVREFFVYLFKEAIICVVEEKKRTLGRLLSSAGAASAFGDGTGSGSINGGSSQKGVLRLKGRIYIRHIRQVTDTSVQGELSLTIDMEDERLDSFILIFKDRSSLETWKQHIQVLVAVYQQQTGQAAQQQPEYARSPDLEEFGGSAKAARMLTDEYGGNQKAMRMLSGSTTGTTVSTADSLLNGSARSTVSSNTSYGSASLGPRPGLHQKLSTLEEDDELSRYSSPQPLVAPHMSSGPSNSLAPLAHPPMDLILVISVPGPTSTPSTAALKIRVIKTSLDFIFHSLSSKDRLSLVTFEVGVGGRVRRTPFLSLGKPQSRQRLQKFIEDIGRREDFDDEFLVRGSQEDKTDVVTAVNNGLDVVLQRKSRNPVTGFVLVSDSSETTRRAQMDLVLARAEAANVPIHSFGYGRSHDPASLWLMSNHTSGTYTFVKDWYDLRDCLAGCIGGMMSIGLANMKLHLKIVDGNRFRIRKISGGPLAILSSDGRDVDVEVGELRYGERKEMLVELELDNSDVLQSPPSPHNGGQPTRALNATDVFNQRMGLDAMSLSDFPDLAEGMMDRMIDEVPVFEVDGSFFDPNAAKNVSRLAHPVLLTVTLLPSTGSRPRTPAPNSSDPVIVRRRMELLASDMITRMLVLVSRRNVPQAQKLMSETRRILHTVLQNVTATLPPPNRDGATTTRNRKEILTMSAVRAIQSIMQDMQILSEALDEHADTFALDQRNFGAQQAKVLRDQKSWSGRSAIERLFWTIDSSIELVSRSTDWVARE